MPVSPETTSELLRQVFTLARAAKAAAGAEPVPGLRLGGLLILSAVDQIGEVRCSDLAEKLELDVSVISRQLSVFESQGLTSRQADPRDGRAWLARITPAGAAVLAQTREQRSRIFSEALADWDEAEARELVGTLARLEAVLHEAARDDKHARV